MAEAERAASSPGAVITGEVADVDLSRLDATHVLPHAGPVVVRGVWFPRRNL